MSKKLLVKAGIAFLRFVLLKTLKTVKKTSAVVLSLAV